MEGDSCTRCTEPARLDMRCRRRRSRMRLLLLVALVTTCLSVDTRAADDETKPVKHGKSEEHEFHRNHAALFLGSTATEGERPGGSDDPRFTLGANYVRRLTRLVGLGVVLETVPEGERELVGFVPVYFYVGKRAKFMIGPGSQRLEEPPETTFVARIGFEYDFDVGPVILSPELNVDYSEVENFAVLGLNIGWGF